MSFASQCESLLFFKALLKSKLDHFWFTGKNIFNLKNLQVHLSRNYAIKKSCSFFKKRKQSFQKSYKIWHFKLNFGTWLLIAPSRPHFWKSQILKIGLKMLLWIILCIYKKIRNASIPWYLTEIYKLYIFSNANDFLFVFVNKNEFAKVSEKLSVLILEWPSKLKIDLITLWNSL